MEKILNFFTPKIGFWASVALLALLAAAITAEEIRLADVRKSLKEAQDKLSVCVEDRATLRANVATLEGAITDQNAKISALEAKNRVLATQAAANAQKALAEGEKRKAEASRLGAGPDVMNAFLKGLIQ